MKPAKNARHGDDAARPMARPYPLQKNRTAGFLVKPSREDRRQKRGWKRTRQ
jgi:hypothetical protein